VVTRLQLREFDEVIGQVIERTIQEALKRAERLGRQDALGRFRDNTTHRFLVISMTSSYKPFFGTRLGFNPEEVRIDIHPVPRLLDKMIPYLERYDERQQSMMKGGRCFLDASGVYRKDSQSDLIAVVKWQLPEQSKYL
jgi:hypothetical protein